MHAVSVSDRRRINVAVSQDTLDAIRQVTERDGVSQTEAVARLIAYGGMVHRYAKLDGRRVLFMDTDGTTLEAIIP